MKNLLCFVLSMALLVSFSTAQAVEEGFTVFHGSRDEKRIAITVDDCYDSENLQAILDLCREYEIAVTFFVIGKALKMDDQPLWQDVLDAGCEIGNHTWSHARLPDLNSRDIKRQLSRTQEKLNTLLGYDYTMRVMRPPYGRLSENANKKSDLWVVEAIEAAGYKHAVRWDVSQTDPDKAIKQVQNGSILLYHANKKDVRCLKQLIPALLEQGYECVTVSALLNIAPDLTWEVTDP